MSRYRSPPIRLTHLVADLGARSNCSFRSASVGSAADGPRPSASASAPRRPRWAGPVYCPGGQPPFGLFSPQMTMPGSRRAGSNPGPRKPCSSPFMTPLQAPPGRGHPLRALLGLFTAPRPAGAAGAAGDLCVKISGPASSTRVSPSVPESQHIVIGRTPRTPNRGRRWKTTARTGLGPASPAWRMPPGRRDVEAASLREMRKQPSLFDPIPSPGRGQVQDNGCSALSVVVGQYFRAGCG